MPRSRVSRLHNALRGSPLGRYCFAIATVAIALALRMMLLPLTGTGAPFVLFIGATITTSLLVGIGPALVTLGLSLTLVPWMLVLPAGASVSEAVFQALLFAVDGCVIIYLASWANGQAERTRQTIELAPDAYFLADVDGCLVDVNPAACTLLGYAREELVGMTIGQTVATDRPTDLRRPGKLQAAEWEQLRKDGSRVSVEVSANVLPDGRWQAFMRDITERKRIADERERLLRQEQAARSESEATNARLRESEERFRLAVDEAPIGMAIVALDGRFVRVNQVLAEITGYSVDELGKLTFQDITHADDLEADVELARKLARGEIPRYQIEKRYVRRDHSVVDIMLSASVLRGPDGKAQYYISQVEDITARKRAETLLRLSEAKFSGIVSIAADAIISVDKDQRVTLFNEGAEAIFGYGRDEAMGMQLGQFMPERFRTAHAGHFAGFAAGSEQARGMGEHREIFGLRKNGDEFPAEASISKVDVDGEMFFSVVLRDVTERKKVQVELQRAVLARDDVLGIVAHDLRNPLSTIMMQAELLERPEPPERRDQTARSVITRSAKRMNRLIKDLLDAAAIEAGQLKVERERVVAPALIKDVVEAQEALAASTGVALQVEIAPGVQDVLGDRNRLHQVFDNLIANALKFTKEGGRVTICAATRGEEVVFSVADSGAGIPAEQLPHVFDRFWQAATHARRLGAGLGLPITRGIVEAHGGRIWVESDAGRGTTFYFTIPVAPSDTQQAATGQAKGRGAILAT